MRKIPKIWPVWWKPWHKTLFMCDKSWKTQQKKFVTIVKNLRTIWNIYFDTIPHFCTSLRNSYNVTTVWTTFGHKTSFRYITSFDTRLHSCDSVTRLEVLEQGEKIPKTWQLCDEIVTQDLIAVRHFLGSVAENKPASLGATLFPY